MGNGKLPQRGSGKAAVKKKRFYCFLSVQERLSLQRLLKINVVHSRPLVEKQEAQLSPSDGAMRFVSSNLASCHATVQKLLLIHDLLFLPISTIESGVS